MADVQEDKRGDGGSRKAEEVQRITKRFNSPLGYKMTNKKFKPPPVTKHHQKLVQIMSGVNGGLDQQLSIFINTVTMNPDEVRLRNEILDDLSKILVSEFPQVRLHPFGSLITSLGDNGSDLDIYVDCNGTIKNGQQVDQAGRNRKKDKEVEFSTVLSILRRLGKKEMKVFGNIVQIPAARVPIIKTIHWSTGVSCDLSFENFLSVRNSKLIKLYTKIHPSVRPLMCLIRYWGKFHDLIDSSKIKNYGLSLLVLVYLIQNGIIPSIYELQFWTPKKARCRIEDWDASFLENEFMLLRKVQEVHGVLPPTTSCRLILQLMLGFCRLYASFDASTDVVCTLTAEFLSRRHFCPGYEQELPPELNPYKEWCYRQETRDRLNVTSDRAFIVQDPFVLNYNVSGVTSAFSLHRFQLACEATADFLEHILNSDEEFKRTKLTDVFFPIRFPDKLRKDDAGEGSKKAEAEREDDPLQPGEKHEPKQMGFSSRPTPEYCQAFFNQFGSCGFPHEEIQFRGNAIWLHFVKEFFLDFFIRCYSFDVTTSVEYLPRKHPPWPPKLVNSSGGGGDENSEASHSVPKVRTKPRHVPRLSALQSSRTPETTGDGPNPTDIKDNLTTSTSGVNHSRDAVDDGAESDDSTLSLSTIELISAIIQTPNPRELLDGINITEYAPQRLTFHFSGVFPNVWDGRGTMSAQIAAEHWQSETGDGDPMELEAEITRRLVAAEVDGDGGNRVPVRVSFDCSITLRPDNFRTVYAEIQFREPQGFRVVPLLKALKSTMSSIVNPYIQYRYALWTQYLAVPVTPGPSSFSVSHSQPKKKLKVRKLTKRRPPRSSVASGSTGQLEPPPPPQEENPPERKPEKKERKKRGELIFVNSAYAAANNINPTSLLSNA